MRDLTVLTILIVSLHCFNATETGEDLKAKKHHTSDERINVKIDQYLELLQKKKLAIEKFLKDNYSDFNHSDYTPEVDWAMVVMVVMFYHCRSMSAILSMPTC